MYDCTEHVSSSVIVPKRDWVCDINVVYMVLIILCNVHIVYCIYFLHMFNLLASTVVKKIGVGMCPNVATPP